MARSLRLLCIVFIALQLSSGTVALAIRPCSEFRIRSQDGLGFAGDLPPCSEAIASTFPVPEDNDLPSKDSSRQRIEGDMRTFNDAGDSTIGIGERNYSPLKNYGNSPAEIQSSPLLTTKTDSTGQELVTITIDMLNSLIRGSKVPPSGPSRDHNWIAASLQQQIYKEPNARHSNTMFFRIQRVTPKDDVIGSNQHSQMQEVGNAITYRIED